MGHDGFVPIQVSTCLNMSAEFDSHADVLWLESFDEVFQVGGVRLDILTISHHIGAVWKPIVREFLKVKAVKKPHPPETKIC